MFSSAGTLTLGFVNSSSKMYRSPALIASPKVKIKSKLLLSEPAQTHGGNTMGGSRLNPRHRLTMMKPSGATTFNLVCSWLPMSLDGVNSKRSLFWPPSSWFAGAIDAFIVPETGMPKSDRVTETGLFARCPPPTQPPAEKNCHNSTRQDLAAPKVGGLTTRNCTLYLVSPNKAWSPMVQTQRGVTAAARSAPGHNAQGSELYCSCGRIGRAEATTWKLLGGMITKVPAISVVEPRRVLPG
mmetsp:Transcript_3562/g.10413  ORF Transcript_3562/g.10413 Transcript_3562/m.10413 type:complete len:241 (+) Transcript_3562:501-1223(+)